MRLSHLYYTNNTVRAGVKRSAFHHVDREPAKRRFLVALVHVEAGLAHRLDHLVEADPMIAGAHHGEPRGLDRLDRADRVALDAGHLDEAADRIAGEAEIVLHADLGGVLDLSGAAAKGGGEACGRHRAG